MHAKITPQTKTARLFQLVLIALLISNRSSLVAAEPVKAKAADELIENIFETSTVSRPLANFHLDLDYTAQKASALNIGDNFQLPLPSGKHNIQLQLQQYASDPYLISVKMNGESVYQNKIIKPNSSPSHYFQAKPGDFPLVKDFTIFASFSAQNDGSLFMRADTSGKWKANAKTLAIKGGKLIYDVGWVGSLKSKKKVTDGKIHHAVVRSNEGTIELYLDGKLIGKNKKLSRKDSKSHLFQIGHGTDFAKNLTNGKVTNVRYWKRSISDQELADLGSGQPEKVNTPDQVWSPKKVEIDPTSVWIPGETVILSLPKTGVQVHSASIQPLDLTDHAKQINQLNAKSLAEGKEIYATLCATCHGDMKKEGSLPTALRFHEGEFKNGADPYRMFKTLEKGYGMMVPQPQYTAEQKYAVIQYIRETFLKKHNPTQFTKVDDNYLKNLPLAIHRKTVKPTKKQNTKPYLEMDYGPYMMGTFQIDKDISNTAQKGIMIRLDEGQDAWKGGVTKGNSWILYDHDTMRVASAYQGSFVNWRSIAFDGSHGTHLSITGDPILTNENQPVWRNPQTKDWKDLRVIGRDGRRYGPLPKSWVNYKGLYKNGNNIIVSYTVGNADIKEHASLINDRIFTRQLQIGPRDQELVTLLGKSSDKRHFALKAPSDISIKSKDENQYLHIPKGSETINIMLGFAEMSQEEIKASLPTPLDLDSLTKGGDGQHKQTITTKGKPGKGDPDTPFLVDEIILPDADSTPGKVWMRLGGFDFFPENPDRAAVCTWQGDVWLVDGVAGDLSTLKWKRIATGLFQPLGLKIVNNKIYVTCRDQLARLHDLNGDEEIDFVESFNHDHQVTEHFHEFAMGLQTDDEGNFYYAKSARHAKVAVVPQHGTLLKVTPDGSTTEIIANGFRAANGVCLNPDGTWIVTDQEGHWNPKNRINYVKKGGFYGNMYGYHDVTDSSDSAMEKPLCWITNAFDRSPAELLWVPEDAAWGKLNGTLLNLSYGYGKIYTVPHEVIDGQAQGGMCALPIEQTETGLHRGRFHPVNKQLYVAGMFAWAGTQRKDGGFYRVRYTGAPAKMPISVQARKNSYTIEFSDAIPAETQFTVKAWDLNRTKNYGSKHINERPLSVTETKISNNKVTLTIPDLTVTRGLEILCTFPDKSTRIIHASINTLK